MIDKKRNISWEILTTSFRKVTLHNFQKKEETIQS